MCWFRNGPRACQGAMSMATTMALAPLPVSALFGHAAISELSLLSGVKRKLDLEPAKGSFWREAAGRRNVWSWGRTDMPDRRIEVSV
jgi:hypothetical protein